MTNLFLPASREPLWKSYRSTNYPEPVVKEQAYAQSYPWILWDGVWVHREHEDILHALQSGADSLTYYKEPCTALKNCINITKTTGVPFVGIRPASQLSDLDIVITQIKSAKELALIGSSQSIHKVRELCNDTTLTVDYFKLRGDFIKSAEEIIETHGSTPIVIDAASIEEYKHLIRDWKHIYALQ